MSAPDAIAKKHFNDFKEQWADDDFRQAKGRF